MRWYRTTLPFLEGTSLINMREYGPDDLQLFTVGELPKWAAKRNYNGQWNMPAGLNGKHVCERRWFPTGEPWPTSLPPTQYDDKWIPLCCRAFHDGAQGGVELGGEAGDKINTTDPTAGGVQIGGAAGDQVLTIDPAAGGLEVGGEAGDIIVTTDEASGGVVLGGEAGDSQASTDPAEGGVEIGGEAGDVLLQIDQAEGGLEIGGAAGDQLLTTDGAAGGLEVGGAAGDGVTFTDAAAGGVEVGGEAGDVFTPGTPDPGSDCASAPDLELAVEYEYDSPTSMMAQQWWHWNLSNGTYHLTVTGLDDPGGASGVYYTGTDCSSLGTPTSINEACETISVTNGELWLRVINMSGTGNTYTFELNTGACP